MSWLDVRSQSEHQIFYLLLSELLLQIESEVYNLFFGSFLPRLKHCNRSCHQLSTHLFPAKYTRWLSASKFIRFDGGSYRVSVYKISISLLSKWQRVYGCLFGMHSCHRILNVSPYFNKWLVLQPMNRWSLKLMCSRRLDGSLSHRDYGDLFLQVIFECLYHEHGFFLWFVLNDHIFYYSHVTFRLDSTVHTFYLSFKNHSLFVDAYWNFFFASLSG